MPSDNEHIAIGRQQRHHRNPTRNYLGDDGKKMEEAGIAGEIELARFLGLPTDDIRSAKRKRGYNFVTPGGDKIDVQCYRKNPAYLPVPVGKMLADIYVLAYQDGAGNVRLLGWAREEEIATARQGKLLNHPRAPVNYLFSRYELRDMDGLKRLFDPQASLF